MDDTWNVLLLKLLLGIACVPTTSAWTKKTENRDKGFNVDAFVSSAEVLSLFSPLEHENFPLLLAWHPLC
eukprot:1161864-Pelagomonas_calceolata.AAC.8